MNLFDGIKNQVREKTNSVGARRFSGPEKFGIMLFAVVLVGYLFSGWVLGDVQFTISLRSNQNLDNGLALYYTFDAANMGTSTATDLSGNAKTGQNYSFASTTNYNGTATTTMIVPSTLGILRMRVKAWGGGGGGDTGTRSGVCANVDTLGQARGGAGGQGGYASADIVVTAGESLKVEAGGAGATTRGGGYSALKRSSTYLVQAGGGGGGGGAVCTAADGIATGGNGGSGGGTSGNSGTNGSNGTGGGGGTSSAGGGGGAGNTGTDGTAGVANAGGNGAGPGTCGSQLTGCGGSGNDGGGGGGGRFGGGGGEDLGATGVDGGGGGGGGSSLVTGTNTTETVGVGTDSARPGTAGAAGAGANNGGTATAGSAGAVVVTTALIATSTSIVPGRVGQGYTLNTVNTISAGNAGSGIKTIAFWMKADDTTDKNVLNFDGTVQVQLSASSQVTATSFPGATTIYVDGASGSAAVATSTWHHVIITDTTGVNASAFEVGMMSFEGVIDDVRLYTRVLSSSEITRLYHLGATTNINAKINTNDTLKSGLVANWSFDGGQMSTNVGDASGQGNSGALQSFTSTTTVLGRLGQGLFFNGSTNYVRRAAAVATTYPLTISAWIKKDTVGTAGLVAGIFDSTQANWYGHYIFINANATVSAGSATNNVSATSTTVATIKAGQWHHVVAVFNTATDRTVYLDGGNSVQDTTSNTPTGLNNTVVGATGKSSPDNFFNGTIDDVRVYSRALTAAEVLRLYHIGATTQVNIPMTGNSNLTSGLIGNWTFDGPRLLQNVTDSSASGNTGFLKNFTSTTTLPGKIGQALNFDGVNDYVTMGDVAAVDAATNLSACAWVFHNTITTDDQIIGKNNGTTDGFMLFRDDVGATSARTDTYSIEADDSADTDSVRLEGATGASSLSAWTHVCATFAAGNVTGLRLYVNGAEDANSPVSVSAVGAIDAGANPLVIGIQSDAATGPFDGRIDDVRVYTRVLSAAEILRLYQLGSGRGSLGQHFALDFEPLKKFYQSMWSATAMLREPDSRRTRVSVKKPS